MSSMTREKRRMRRNLENPALWSQKFHKAMDKLDKVDYGDRHMETAWGFRRTPAPFHNGRKK